MITIRYLVFVLMVVGYNSPTFAYEHENSLVNFQEYSGNVISKNRIKKKPYFLLFSAEWCYWCHQFANKTLARHDVADYLNKHYINVFVDADINNSAYVEYRATGLPFTVFLNPDGSLYYQYAGTLYGDNFLAVIKEVSSKVGANQYALGMEAHRISYTPPSKLTKSDLEDLPKVFKQGLMDNFDTNEFGLGKGQKAILPQAFLYLLNNAETEDRKQIIEWATKTLERAIDRIYDPVEGGFFRYAEKRNWQIPHYEKLADLNAGAVFFLYKLNQLAPSAKLKEAADKTLSYLTSNLYHPLTGTFLSFQVADNYYYTLNEDRRKSVPRPKVMSKVFTDRLAVTLSYLMPVSDYAKDRALEIRIKQSLDFLAKMIEKNKGLSRYYEVGMQQWFEQGGLADYAYVASLYSDAASRYQSSYYAEIASKIVRKAISDFYDYEKGVFIDPSIDNSTNVEYLMEINSLLILSMNKLSNRLNPDDDKIINSTITYFSQIATVLEDRFWNAVDWEFTAAYVPYLQALEYYLPTRSSN